MGKSRACKYMPCVIMKLFFACAECEDLLDAVAPPPAKKPRRLQASLSAVSAASVLAELGDSQTHDELPDTRDTLVLGEGYVSEDLVFWHGLVVFVIEFGCSFTPDFCVLICSYYFLL